MSQNPEGLIDTLIVPRARDIGGFEVRRALPAPKRQMVGPFIFFDQIGPAELLTDQGLDVRPHPHIGLGTVTYLYQGEFEHRDSTGSRQMITPGAVNWMLAGAGVTHSERSTPQTRAAPQSLFGVQTWIALPEGREDLPAAFEHHGRDSLPVLTDGGAEVRLILGTGWGAASPVTMQSELFYADVTLAAGAKLPLPDTHEDRGLHIMTGSVIIAGDTYNAGQMMVFRPGDAITVTAGEAGARFMTLGGATLNGPRYIWWNFVHSDPDRIEEAKAAWRAADWTNGPFRLPQGDDHEFVPITAEMDRMKIKR